MRPFRLPNPVATLMIAAVSLMIVHPAAANPFPDVVDTNGQAADVSGYFGAGNWTVVMFWATDCSVCLVQKPLISGFYDQYKDKGVNVIGLALDGREKTDLVKDYIAEHQPSFPSYIGELGQIAVNYELATQEPFRGTPTYLVFNPAGELVGNNPGMLRVEALERFIARNSG